MKSGSERWGMKKSILLALAILLCSSGNQWAQGISHNWWVIVNASITPEGAYVVVTTHEKNQDILAVLNPGDTGAYPVAPTHIAVYSALDNRLLKNVAASVDRRNPSSLVISGKTSSSIVAAVGPALRENPDRLYLLNVTPYEATFRLPLDICSDRSGSLEYGKIELIRTGECRFSAIHGFFNVHGSIVQTKIDVSLDRTRVWGLYVFREHPTIRGTFQITGPWQFEVGASFGRDGDCPIRY